MKQVCKEYLFARGYLVADGAPEEEHAFETLFALAALFNIRVTRGEGLVQREMISFAEEQLGAEVPEPFYRGFPQSVRALSRDQLLFDQCLHYLTTYGLGLFGEAGHSRFETLLERAAFKEKAAVRPMAVIDVCEAEALIAGSVGNLLTGTRPLNELQYAVVLAWVSDHDDAIPRCGSKNTAIRLLADTRRPDFIRFLTLSDVIRLVDEINYRSCGNEDMRCLNLPNKDRKFITSVINALFAAGRCDIEACSEKKALWCGLLHHIHYKPVNEEAARFTAFMRGKGNLSVYSRFERALAAGDVRGAVTLLQDAKGTGAVLRNLSYLVSRCASAEDAAFVIDHLESCSAVLLLLQLLIHYSFGRVVADGSTAGRDFCFTFHNKLKVHHETLEELVRRRSWIGADKAEAICSRIMQKLREILRGRLGRVYVDPGMRSVGLPLRENTAQSGPGVLPMGTRIAIEEGRKIRAFTYWEGVDDIDLSVIGFDGRGNQREFSWRSMADFQSKAITFSGDETSGFFGGSEYFDIDPAAFRKLNPSLRYLVFCDNVFTGLYFSECTCRAGYMLRDVMDSGEIFEPKTVRSSFAVNCESTFAYLFGIDLETNEFVWMNAARNGGVTVAGSTDVGFLAYYFGITRVINMYTFFEMMAAELVDDPARAEIVVSDRITDPPAGAEIIRSCDIDKVLALMNQ